MTIERMEEDEWVIAARRWRRFAWGLVAAGLALVVVGGWLWR